MSHFQTHQNNMIMGEQPQGVITSLPPAIESTGQDRISAEPFKDTELVLGLIGAVGTQLDRVQELLKERLVTAGYEVLTVRISQDVIPDIISPKSVAPTDEYSRIMASMDAGNEARQKSKNNSILALGTAAFINSKREKNEEGIPKHALRRAHIVSSLKHPAEVAKLRDIYPQGFYLIGVHSDENRRLKYLKENKRISSENAKTLIARDQDENIGHGQKLIDTFYLSDFFVRIDGQDDQLKFSLWRILDLLFGHPNVTPTFDEHAMFMAFAASLRSADLSRQVGAVVAINEQVVATGGNDCPQAGGGLYWPVFNPKTHEIEDVVDGRDYKRGFDSNKRELVKIIEEIVAKAETLGVDTAKYRDALKDCRVQDLTEFGRVVHAEMDALLSCAKCGIRMSGGTLYTTTFPCHNCAKHIIASGIRRVVFIEPYAKSKAGEFHTDSIRVGFADGGNEVDLKKVSFEPFVGVGPRRFFDLFSMKLGSGYALKRRDDTGKALTWSPENGRARLQMLPGSYLDLELIANDQFDDACQALKEQNHGK